MLKNFFLLLAFFLTTSLFAQTNYSKPENYTKKTVTTRKINKAISIDGKLDEEEWQTVQPAKDFITFEPDNGKPEHDTQKSRMLQNYLFR